MSFDPNPAAIVRTVEMSRADRIKQVEHITAGIRHRNRLNKDAAVELGEQLMHLKATFRHGEWLPFLESKGIGRRQAQRAMALFSNATHDAFDQFASEEDALAELGILDEEEQEIPEGEQPVQTSAFAEDETSSSNGTGQKGQRKAVCPACVRDLRVGRPLPPRCPECVRLVKENQAAWKTLGPKRRMKQPTGGSGKDWVGIHFRGLIRHTLNGAVDRGMQIDRDNLPDQVKQIEARLREVKEMIQEWWKQIRKEAKGGTG